MIGIKHRVTMTALYEADVPTTRDAVIQALVERVSLAGADLARAFLMRADLYCARLDGANLTGADLNGAFLTRASLDGADLTGARLDGATLDGADLARADLTGADLTGARLDGANLDGAIMPDGRPWAEYRADPLAGICQDTEARSRAVAAWGNHRWDDCPMHAANGYTYVADAPEAQRIAVAAFVAAFDSRLLPKPEAR